MDRLRTPKFKGRTELCRGPGVCWLKFYTRNECGFRSSPLVSSVILASVATPAAIYNIAFGKTGYESSSVLHHLLHSFRVYFTIFSTRFECITPSSPLVSSVLNHLLHSFRVYFTIFSTLSSVVLCDYFISAGDDCKISVWSVQSGLLIGVLHGGHRKPVSFEIPDVSFFEILENSRR